MPYADPEKSKRYKRQWYLRNRNRILAKEAKKHAINPGNPWTKANPEKSRVYLRQWHKKNPEKRKEYDRRKRNTRTDLINRFKSRPCMDCGRQYQTWQMDFDHRPGEAKLFSIGEDKHRALSVVLAEIAKCDIVCANCHRDRTYRRLQSA